MFRTSSVQVKIITLVSLLEYIISTHSFERGSVIRDEWKESTISSFISEIVSTDYCSNNADAKQSGKYNLFCSFLGKLNEKSMKRKIIELCTECGLNVKEDTIGHIYKIRNNWIHGGPMPDMETMATSYSALKMIVQMITIYETTGRSKNYQSFMNPFTDRNGIVIWKNFPDNGGG